MPDGVYNDQLERPIEAVNDPVIADPVRAQPRVGALERLSGAGIGADGAKRAQDPRLKPGIKAPVLPDGGADMLEADPRQRVLLEGLARASGPSLRPGLSSFLARARALQTMGPIASRPISPDNRC